MGLEGLVIRYSEERRFTAYPNFMTGIMMETKIKGFVMVEGKMGLGFRHAEFKPKVDCLQKTSVWGGFFFPYLSCG